jgi:hypothetical protein
MEMICDSYHELKMMSRYYSNGLEKVEVGDISRVHSMEEKANIMCK